MTSAKALAAIALTLVIIVPIGLGYALAIDETEHTGVQTAASYNISDRMLNSSTPYYNDTISGNNSFLIRTTNLEAKDVALSSPDYVSTGAKVSSIPTYSQESTTVACGTTITGRYSLEPGMSIGTTESATIHVDPTDGIEHINITSEAAASLHWLFRYYFADGTYGEKYTKAIYLFKSENGYDYGDIRGVQKWEIVTNVYGEYRNVAYAFGSVSLADAPTSISPTYANSEYRINGTIYGRLPASTTAIITWPSSKVIIGTEVFEDVHSLEITSNSLRCTSEIPTSSYADPSAGWTIPEEVGAEYTWLNGQVNQSADIMLKLRPGTFASVELDGTHGITVSRTAEGMTYVYDGTRTDLGAYEFVRVRVDADDFTVSGITSWPSIGGTPTVLNSVHTGTGYADGFTRLDIGGTAGDDAPVWRVDNTSILAGSFPSTEDYTLETQQMFPGKDVAVRLTSIGVYGDSLTFGDEELAVSGGAVTVGDSKINLKGAMLSWSDGTVSINGKDTGIECDEGQVTFGGEWSLTAYAYELEEVTTKSMEWKAGEFAFDSRGLCAAGLAVCGLVCIGLGMTGQRSGVKIGLLMLVCGGAAFAYLTLI